MRYFKVKYAWTLVLNYGDMNVITCNWLFKSNIMQMNPSNAIKPDLYLVFLLRCADQTRSYIYSRHQAHNDPLGPHNCLFFWIFYSTT